MDELYQRLDRIEHQVTKIKNKRYRKDLQKMIRTIDSAMLAMDQESVECRRLHKETLRHKELAQKAGDLMTTLEQHLTFVALLDG